MSNYLEDVTVKGTEDLKNSHSYYPRNDQLFKVVKDLPRLPLKDTALFQRHVARELFSNKRARSDI